MASRLGGSWRLGNDRLQSFSPLVGDSQDPRVISSELGAKWIVVVLSERQNLEARLMSSFRTERNERDLIYWIHCISLINSPLDSLRSHFRFELAFGIVFAIGGKGKMRHKLR